MKKLLAILLALMMVLGLAACGEEKGITIVNKMGMDLEDIFIVTAGSSSWGEKPAVGYLDNNVGAYVYPEELFGKREIRVDIRAVAEDGVIYEVFDVAMSDGDSCTMEMDEMLFMFYVGEEAYIGQRNFDDVPDPTEDPDVDPDPTGEPVTGYTKADYEGYWMYDNGNLIYINDGEWTLYDNEGAQLAYGIVDYTDYEAKLQNEDGSDSGVSVAFDEYGDLMDGDQMLTHYDTFPYGNSETQDYNHLLEGEWLYSDQENVLVFDGLDHYTWTFPEYVETGNYMFDGEWVRFYYDGGEGDYYEARYDEEAGCLYVEGDAGSFYYLNEE